MILIDIAFVTAVLITIYAFYCLTVYIFQPKCSVLTVYEVMDDIGEFIIYGFSVTLGCTFITVITYYYYL